MDTGSKHGPCCQSFFDTHHRGLNVQSAGNDHPLEDEQTPAGGPDQADGPHQADPADPAVDDKDQAVDDTIRLNWREKLVEGGLVMAMAMVGTLIGGIGRPYFSDCHAQYPGGFGAGIHGGGIDPVHHPDCRGRGHRQCLFVQLRALHHTSPLSRQRIEGRNGWTAP